METSGAGQKGARRGGAVQVPASEVKNAWHEYVDRVSRCREEIVVTRYGKPIMKLVPVDGEEDRAGIIGVLAGTVTVHGDIISSLGEAWEADD